MRISAKVLDIIFIVVPCDVVCDFTLYLPFSVFCKNTEFSLVTAKRFVHLCPSIVVEQNSETIIKVV